MDRSLRFTVKRLDWQDEFLGEIDLPKARLRMVRSFGSGLARRLSDPRDIVWAVGDRGPNLKIKTMVDRYGADHLAHLRDLDGAKIMPRPDIGPRVARLRIGPDAVELLSSFPVSDADGAALSGLPMPGSEHATHEPALTLAGDAMAGDASGLDTEGLVALEDGTFVLSDEFGPSLVRTDADGQVLSRHLPEGSGSVGARYPVLCDLPAIAARRQLNRGFEAVAITADQKWLFVAFQSPLAHPDEAAHKRARHVRLWQLDAATLGLAAEYLYPLDPPETFLRDNAKGALAWSDLKVSELICLPDGSQLALERGSETTKIYRFALSPACALPPADRDSATSPTIEQRSASGEPLPCVTKRLLFSSDHAPEMSADMEGMVVLSPSELLLVSDNDFGVEGAETSFWKITFAEPILA